MEISQAADNVFRFKDPMCQIKHHPVVRKQIADIVNVNGSFLMPHLINWLITGWKKIISTWIETRWVIWPASAGGPTANVNIKALFAGLLANDQTYIFIFTEFVFFKTCSSHFLHPHQADSCSSMDLDDDILHKSISMPWTRHTD